MNDDMVRRDKSVPIRFRYFDSLEQLFKDLRKENAQLQKPNPYLEKALKKKLDFIKALKLNG